MGEKPFSLLLNLNKSKQLEIHMGRGGKKGEQKTFLTIDLVGGGFYL